MRRNQIKNWKRVKVGACGKFKGTQKVGIQDFFILDEEDRKWSNYMKFKNRLREKT